MARKLGPANFPLEQDLALNNFPELLERSDALRGTGPWWQAPPHFFDSRELEVLLEPESPKRTAPER